MQVFGITLSGLGYLLYTAQTLFKTFFYVNFFFYFFNFEQIPANGGVVWHSFAWIWYDIGDPTASRSLAWEQGLQIEFGYWIDMIKAVFAVYILYGHLFADICRKYFTELNAELIKGIYIPYKGFNR